MVPKHKLEDSSAADARSTAAAIIADATSGAAAMTTASYSQHFYYLYCFDSSDERHSPKVGFADQARLHSISVVMREKVRTWLQLGWCHRKSPRAACR